MATLLLIAIATATIKKIKQLETTTYLLTVVWMFKLLNFHTLEYNISLNFKKAKEGIQHDSIHLKFKEQT